MTAPRLWLVVPCFNEAGRLAPDPFLDLLASRPRVAVLFVDDGSRDGTLALLERLAARGGERAQVLALPSNLGKAGAVHRGVQAAVARAPELVGYWDADLATPLSALDDFLAVIDARPEVSIVMGARVQLLGRAIGRRPLRHYLGRVSATAASLALGIPVYDTQCGAKIFRMSGPTAGIFSAPFQAAWAFDVELLARYVDLVGPAAARKSIYELALREWSDVPGSKLRARHLLRAGRDLALIMRRKKPANPP